MSTPSMKSHGRWLVWIPVLMVGALLYWTVALGLGGLSLMALTVLSCGTTQEYQVEDSAPPLMPTATPTAVGADDSDLQRIVVNLRESVEPEDVDDNAGAGTPALGQDGQDTAGDATVDPTGVEPMPGS